VHLVEHGPAVLAPFSERTREYATSALTHKQVQLHLGVGATEVHADRVVLSDGTVIPTRTVVWAAGIRANPLGDELGLPQVRDGRIPVQADLTIEGHPDVYALGDQAAIPGPDGRPLPQLGSVALQSGVWAARNIVARREGKDPTPFHYKDKGIMAMIGRNAAVAEVGAHHHRLHGPIAFSAWLGVHAWLLSGVRERIDAFVSWGWDYFSENREYAVLDHDAGRIDWSADD
jgi:NADH dehydrogenase